ncbi:flagellar basal body L-ring protein FlgH [Segnochrobactrum spirostomi]|uniref:Flagellar L-ring protein n=1 Tax=Segnochrobactrum spirostomi TaxID=2608987 RepID=A0A6A7Y4V5_9HYPH|nr:flagellar basal body L-ring protein FlgH [Segnochrobactrum spirostomi]MQT12762.1 flagellar basal body L-ring protein FlgH [Segnochrobactrum spirostomi]
MRHYVMAAVLLALAGCQSTKEDSLTQTDPPLSPVGYGLKPQRESLPMSFANPVGHSPHSTYGRNSQQLFADLRASNVGDTVTVNIALNNNAQFDNTSDRLRESTGQLGGSATIAGGGFGIDDFSLLTGNALVGEATKAKSKGAGSIDRSEKLNLQVATTVTEVLPNGNLVVSGSQEIRVNYEVRVLTLAGIIRPLDILSNNTISYEKVAEARISYGGRGRISDQQLKQKGWMEPVYNAIIPY